MRERRTVWTTEKRRGDDSDEACREEKKKKNKAIDWRREFVKERRKVEITRERLESMVQLQKESRYLSLYATRTHRERLITRSCESALDIVKRAFPSTRTTETSEELG